MLSVQMLPKTKCSPVQMLPGPNAPRSKCSLVQMLSDQMLPGPNAPQNQMLPGPNAPWSKCSLVQMLPSPNAPRSKCSQKINAPYVEITVKPHIEWLFKVVSTQIRGQRLIKKLGFYGEDFTMGQVIYN